MIKHPTKGFRCPICMLHTYDADDASLIFSFNMVMAALASNDHIFMTDTGTFTYESYEQQSQYL